MYISLAGYHWKHDENFFIERKDGYNGMQLLLIQSRAKVSIAGISYNILPNTAIIIDTSVSHCLYANGEEYMDDWVRFQLSREERQEMEDLDIPFNVPVCLNDDDTLELLIKSACQMFDNENLDKKRIQHNLLMAMLLYIGGVGKESRSEKKIPYESELRKLRKEIYENPGVERSAPQIARELNLSVGYLNKIYNELFGTSYMKDVFSSRMEYAQTLLSKSDKTVNEIAELCGYNSSEHFSRSFKKYSCMSPLQYRNNGGKQN
jgi:AraC family transcriptional regulator of arabinose operon